MLRLRLSINRICRSSKGDNNVNETKLLHQDKVSACYRISMKEVRITLCRCFNAWRILQTFESLSKFKSWEKLHIDSQTY